MGIKYPVNEEFFDDWDPAMAYVLGYLYADGNLENASYLRGRYIRFSSVDRDILEKVKQSLCSAHKIVSQKPGWPNGKQRYLLRIGSHKIYNSLLKYGLYPNKSLTIKFPDVPPGYLADFIRGYFDGDGCVSLYKVRGVHQEVVVKRLLIAFTSGSIDFLNRLAALLRQGITLKQSTVYVSHRSYQLRYSTEDSIKLFKFMYASVSQDLYLARKLNVFRDYFKIRPQRIDGEVHSTLNRFYTARWPSGLGKGLQNPVRRFDSAPRLKGRGRLEKVCGITQEVE